MGRKFKRNENFRMQQIHLSAHICTRFWEIPWALEWMIHGWRCFGWISTLVESAERETKTSGLQQTRLNAIFEHKIYAVFDSLLGMVVLLPQARKAYSAKRTRRNEGSSNIQYHNCFLHRTTVVAFASTTSTLVAIMIRHSRYCTLQPEMSYHYGQECTYQGPYTVSTATSLTAARCKPARLMQSALSQ